MKKTTYLTFTAAAAGWFFLDLRGSFLYLCLISISGVIGLVLFQWLSRPKTVKVLKESYDYIIVGAGSSGSVLASRLSEDPSISVLVLEAGGSEEWSLSMTIPIFHTMLQRSKYDWSFYTEPQKYACKGLRDNKSCWPRGRVLGGSSCLNYMVYVRGSRHDFDDWAANGCEGWSYKDVLPYFIKSENIQIPELRNSDYRGKEGPLHISSGCTTPLADIYVEAMEELGYNVIDCNGKDELGYCKIQLSTKNGTRCSTVKAFLRPAMSRNNLHVSVNAMVTRVLIENKKAVGVEVTREGKQQIIKCNKEVILSAGAIGSPHILMLSGVGPKEHLMEHGLVGFKYGRQLFMTFLVKYADVPSVMNSVLQMSLKAHHQCHLAGVFLNEVIRFVEESEDGRTSVSTFSLSLRKITVHADVPVGKNLQDHIFSGMSFFPNQSMTVTISKILSPKSILNWLFRSKGYLTMCGLEGNAFLRTMKNDQFKHPDIQLAFYSASHPQDKWKDAADNFNIEHKYAHVVTTTEKVSKERFGIVPILLHPKSRGTIKLRSNNPQDYPIIDPNYLSEKEDVETLIRGLKLSLQIANTSVFKKYGVDDSHPEIIVPELNGNKYGTDAYWEEYVRHFTLTGYHPTSSCTMGSADDPDAVVDPTLRIRGVENLRVVDCSVMRTITSGNTNAPAIMIGEKAADLILKRDSVRDIKQRIKHILDRL